MRTLATLSSRHLPLTRRKLYGLRGFPTPAQPPFHVQASGNAAFGSNEWLSSWEQVRG
jgi:hypothetical protein